MEQPISTDAERLAQINELLDQNKMELFKNPEALERIVATVKESSSVELKKEIISRILSERRTVAKDTHSKARGYSGATPYSVIYADRIKANRLAIQAVMAIVFPNSLATANNLYKVFQKHMDEEHFFNDNGKPVCTMITDYEGLPDAMGNTAYINFHNKVFEQFDRIRKAEANIALRDAEEKLNKASQIVEHQIAQNQSLVEKKEEDKSVVPDSDEGLVSENPDEQQEAAPSSKETVLMDLETVKGMAELDLLSPEQLAQLGELLGQIKKTNVSKLAAPTDKEKSSLSIG